MPFQPLLVRLPDVLNGKHGPVVRIFRVVGAVFFIGVYLGQNLGKLFLCVGQVPQQFVVEVQDAGPVLK